MTPSASPETGGSGPHAYALGLFESETDVGKAGQPGSGRYDPAEDTYTIAGSGANIWGVHDAFHFVWKRMSGNFVVTCRAEFVGEGVEPHRKLGWMVRANLDPGSPHVSAGVHGDGLTSLQLRRRPGGQTEEVRLPVTGANVIQLERRGARYIMSAARFGDPLERVDVADVELGDEVYVGLYVCSHNDAVLETAIFHDPRIVVPAPEDFVRGRDVLGSNLEILDVESGRRRIIFQLPEPFEAPNWTPDGRALIYNSHGHLYRFDLEEQRPVMIDTGFATHNNNDHVLSFDGTKLGISQQSAEDQGASIVYTLPVEGGQPTRATANGPSYLHGWSPDGKLLVYTGSRNGEFDIYQISVEGGEETRLTTAPGLDDGPEYTPDGRWIYFNSVRSGRMQIWRMRPDGSGQEQVTDDEYNNWFAHISPDGRSIIFLTFLPDVDPSDHPPYKQVYLRLMPAAGGTPRVIAYVYGGQGTINVPSWSPDSQHVAFVSYTDMR